MKRQKQSKDLDSKTETSNQSPSIKQSSSIYRVGTVWTNRALFKLIWPLIIDQILLVMVGIIDTVMVGQLGDASVSGVSIVDSINNLVLALFAALTTGGAVIVSQYLGKRNPRLAEESAKQLIYISVLLSCFFSLVMFLGRGPILRLIYGDLGDAVFHEAETYFFYTALTYPFLALNTAGSALFRSMGNSRVGMWVSLLINILNFGGDAFFIFVCDMGVAGAAIATLASRFVSGVLIIWLLWRVKPDYESNTLTFSIRGLSRIRLKPAILQKMMRIAVPNAVENGMYQFGKLALARLITSFGTAAIAGNAIGNIFMIIGNLPGMAVSNGMITVVGQDMGAGKIAEAKGHIKKLMGWMYGAMTGYNIMILLAMPLIFKLFALSPEALAYGRLFGTIFCTADILFWSPSYGLPNALRASGDAAFTMWVGVFSMWILRVGVAYLLANAFGVGPVCVWISMCCEWVVRGITFTARLFSGKWQQKKVI